MVSLQKIEPSRFVEIYPLLRELSSRLSEDTWQRLFDYQWQQHSNYCGYGLFDGDTAVGFLGMIFSQRQIANQTTNFCNLAAWVVRPDYRSHSLSLMMPAIRLKDHTITDLSAAPGVSKLAARLGFQPLDASVRVLFPCGGRATTKGGKIYRDDEIAKLPLEPSDFQVFVDHQPYANCHQLVLQTEQGYCHILYTLCVHPILPYCHIQAISNTVVFEQYQSIIRRSIIRDTGIPLIIVDSRLVTSLDLPFSYQLSLETPRLFRSQQLQPSQIDNAYSEYVLLSLRTQFGLRKRLIDTLPAGLVSRLRHWHSERLDVHTLTVKD